MLCNHHRAQRPARRGALAWRPGCPGRVPPACG